MLGTVSTLAEAMDASGQRLGDVVVHHRAFRRVETIPTCINWSSAAILSSSKL